MAGIEDLLARPATLGILPQATRALDSQQVAQMKETKQDTLDKQLAYREKLKEVELSAMERQGRKKKLEFDLANQDEMLELEHGADTTKLKDPIYDDMARDVPFIKDEATYGQFVQKHQRYLPQELRNPDGSAKPYREAIPLINDFRKSRVYNVEHQRDLNLEQVKASATQPSFTAPSLDPRELDASMSTTDKALKEGGIDLGSISKKSDARDLGYTVGEIAAAVEQAAADAGRKVNKGEIRKKVLEIALRNVSDNRFNIGKWAREKAQDKIPIAGKIPDMPLSTPSQDFSINWQGLNQEVNSTFGISGNFGPRDEFGLSVSGPAANMLPQFDDEGAAEAAFQKGQIKVGDKITIGGIPGTWQ
jgi:hypothetical protein